MYEVSMDIQTFIMATLLCLAIGEITYHKGLLTGGGAVAATLFGVIIAFIHPSWLVLLFAFLLLGVIVTRYRFSEKEKRGVQEGEKGERGHMNVISTGVVPLAIAILSFPPVAVIPVELSGIFFLTSVATAASDTLASEMGVLSSGSTRMITTMKEVRPGTNGGVSAYGTAWALIGAFSVSVAGGLFLSYFSHTFPQGMVYLLIPGTMGFAGCLIDSILGATLEERGIIGKGHVNLISELLSAVLVLPFLYLY